MKIGVYTLSVIIAAGTTAGVLAGTVLAGSATDTHRIMDGPRPGLVAEFGSPSALDQPARLSSQVSRQVRGMLKLRLLGDVNGDGYVGFDDLLLVAGALGIVPLAAEARVLDWNLDGQLDVRDLAIVASRLGSRLG